MKFTNTDCVRNLFSKGTRAVVDGRNALNLWEWVLAQTYKIRNKISEEIER